MVANEKWFGAGASGFYNGVATQSLRLNESSSSHLTFTPDSAGNQKKCTISAWVKRSSIGDSGATEDVVFHAGTTNGHRGHLRFYEDHINWNYYNGSSWILYLITTDLFRDTTSFYHLCANVDTVAGTAKLWVNGFEPHLSNNTIPTSSQDLSFADNVEHQIGERGNVSGGYFHGYICDVHFIDGSALDYTQFAEFKNGTLIPKTYSGSYGQNGFRLEFKNTTVGGTNPTSSTIGADTSGNNNHFNDFNLDSHDSNFADCPENNFPTLNILQSSNNASTFYFSEGNLALNVTNNSGYRNCSATFSPMGIKGYFEFCVTTGTPNFYIGVIEDTTHPTNGDYGDSSHNHTMLNSNSGVYQNAVIPSQGNKIVRGGSTYLPHNIGTIATGDVLGLAFDFTGTNRRIWFHRANTYGTSSSGVGNPSTGANPVQSETYLDSSVDYRFHLGANSGGGLQTVVFNFGQNGTFNGTKTSQGNKDSNDNGDFFYPVPTDFIALCSASLNDTAISPNQDSQGSDFNQVVFYNGNGSNSHQITGVGFKPDMVHIKVRNQSGSHYNIDSRRGIGTGDSFKALGFNTSVQEYTAENDQLRSLDADGFTLDNNTDNTWYVNRSSDTYNSWNWRCGSDTPTKTFKVKVVADSTDYGHGTGSNKYQFLKSDGTTGFGTNGIDLDLTEGGTYIFDWSDSSAQSHPIRFSLTNDGTHSSGTSAGSEYTTGVVKNDSAYLTTITLPTTASGGVANLYYYCQNHSGMGAEINTNPITQKGETNFDGTILSVLQVNNDIGMSIGTFNAISGTYYFGHGLSQAPEFFMIKSLVSGDNWIAYHKARTPSIPNTKGLYVNSPTLPTGGSNWIQEVSATRIGITTGVLTGTGEHLLYAWHSVDGYCKVGQYEGNNTTTNNAYVYTGFLPNIVWIKNVDNGQDWIIRDLKHSGYYTDDRRNPVNIGSSHSKNNPHTGASAFGMDFLSNGFKIRGNNSDIGSSHTFMYIAWATDKTFKFSNAR